MDMDTLLLAVIEQELSEVPVVVDHFHLIQDANRRVDEARKIEQDACRREIPKKIFLFGFRNVQIYIRKMLLWILPLAVLHPWLPH